MEWFAKWDAEKPHLAKITTPCTECGKDIVKGLHWYKGSSHARASGLITIVRTLLLYRRRSDEDKKEP